MAVAGASPLISVILPFYNAPRLNIAVKSILDQSFDDFELILVDNNSDDQSPIVAKSFFEKDKRVRLIQESRRGVVWAMNTGIGVAGGEYVARMDADDYAFPNRLGLQLNLLRSESSLGLVSGLVEYEGDAQNTGFRYYVDWMNGIVDDRSISLNQFVEFPIANPTMMLRRSLFDKVGLFKDGSFPEDYDFFLRLQLAGVRMEKVQQKILRWNDSPSRLTRTDARYSKEAFYHLKAKYLASWLKKNNQFHPNVYVWGAGRVSRRRSQYLLEHGIEIVKYIDLDRKANVIHYNEVPSKEVCFIVSYVGNRGARNQIWQFLSNRGFREGEHFILAS